jgi:hypothetical protein
MVINHGGISGMKHKRTLKVFALAVLMPMLIIAFAVAPAQSKSTDYQFAKDVKIDETVDLSQVPLTIEQLTMLEELVPYDLLPYLMEAQYIYICGNAHIDLKISEVCDNYVVDLHFTWKGTIVLLDSSRDAIVTLYTKCLELNVHGTISKCDPNQICMCLDFQTNSVLCFADSSVSKPIDLKLHTCVDLSSADFDWIKGEMAQFMNAGIV